MNNKTGLTRKLSTSSRIRSQLNNIKSRHIFEALMVAACIFLIVIHGIEPEKFDIDEYTLGLLVFCFIPVLRKMLDSIKAGGVEFNFRQRTKEEQILIFLDGIATKQKWTLFKGAREGEIEIGPGFKEWIDILIENKPTELKEKLLQWLKDGDSNLKYFAAEVIGYARAEDLSRAVKVHISEDISSDWPAWRLNCLWAYSRFDNYRTLVSRLDQNPSVANKKWIVEACRQMLEEERSNEKSDDAGIRILEQTVEKFQNQ